MEWQPIETAPKDGAWFSAWDGSEVFPCCWGDWFGQAGWCYGDCTYGGTLYEGLNLADIQPTHWMPLPEPPK